MTEIEKRRIALGKRITQRRQEINMTMDELAHLMGYKHRSSIQKLENGENGLPSDKVEELAGYLQMDPTELMRWIRLDAKNHGMTKLVQKALEQVMPSEEEFKMKKRTGFFTPCPLSLIIIFVVLSGADPQKRTDESTHDSGCLCDFFRIRPAPYGS